MTFVMFQNVSYRRPQRGVAMDRSPMEFHSRLFRLNHAPMVNRTR
jgi:hypothetical protein